MQFDYTFIDDRLVSGISSRVGVQEDGMEDRVYMKNPMLQGGKELESVKVWGLDCPSGLSLQHNGNISTYSSKCLTTPNAIHYRWLCQRGLSTSPSQILVILNPASALQ